MFKNFKIAKKLFENPRRIDLFRVLSTNDKDINSIKKVEKWKYKQEYSFWL